MISICVDINMCWNEDVSLNTIVKLTKLIKKYILDNLNVYIIYNIKCAIRWSWHATFALAKYNI